MKQLLKPTKLKIIFFVAFIIYTFVVILVLNAFSATNFQTSNMTTTLLNVVEIFGMVLYAPATFVALLLYGLLNYLLDLVSIDFDAIISRMTEIKFLGVDLANTLASLILLGLTVSYQYLLASLVATGLQKIKSRRAARSAHKHS